MSTLAGPPADANNGDQFFNATFGGGATISNGLPEFPPAFLPVSHTLSCLFFLHFLINFQFASVINFV